MLIHLVDTQVRRDEVARLELDAPDPFIFADDKLPGKRRANSLFYRLKTLLRYLFLLFQNADDFAGRSDWQMNLTASIKWKRPRAPKEEQQDEGK